MPRRKLRSSTALAAASSSDEEESNTTSKKPAKKPSQKKPQKTKRKLPQKSKVKFDSSDEEPIIKKKEPYKFTDITIEESSSDSDIEKYLQPVTKIDLSSSFFTSSKKQKKETLKNEFSSSDSESDFAGFSSSHCKPPENENSFQQFIDYTNKMEEAKKHAEIYNSKKESHLQLQVKETDIFNMLAKSEPSLIAQNKKQLQQTLHSSDFESCSSENEDWEEVNANKDKKPSSQKPNETIEITLEMPNVIKKKKGTDILAAMKRRFNRIKKENQVYVHKVHLLCWIAYGNYVNSVLNNEEILARALSLLPSDKSYPGEETDLRYLERILCWYTKSVKNVGKEIPDNLPLDVLLKRQIKKKEVYSRKMMVFVFVAVLRSLGVQCRVVFSLLTVPLRPPASELCSLRNEEKEKKSELVVPEAEKSTKRSRSTSSKLSKPAEKESKTRSKSETEQPTRKLRSNSVTSKFFNSSPSKKTLDVRNDILQLVKSRISDEREADRQKLARKPSKSSEHKETVRKKTKNRDDDDFMPKIKVKQRVNPKASTSSTPEKNNNKKKIGSDVWIEVFLEKEDKWICVDVEKNEINKLKAVYSRATLPLAYILAWNNNSSVKDITRKYCENFNTITRKLRVDSKWWTSSLKAFEGVPTLRDRVEDCEMEKQQLEQPLPKSITEYKNHPLYVLKRHLLKFEAIYPPDSVPLGYVRKEEIYSRKCVFTLHSREIWLKHAKVVRVGETPYKIVKARPKYDKLSNTMITDQMLEVFGPWQTEDYVPPTAENGKVPRNAFGNVELFKECMLPKKTVHLKLPGLNKVARKLNIDCAAALVGFDFHGGWNHPTYDGFVVCEEFENVLVDAWETEQVEIEKRESEKLEKRVYGNWKKLIRGLLIRERLNARYEFGAPKNKKKR